MNTDANQHYKGAWPDISFYDPDFMSEQERGSFLEWYQGQRHKEFDFEKEITAYVKADVSVLRLACIAFRERIFELTGGIDDKGNLTGQGIDVFSKVGLHKSLTELDFLFLEPCGV